MIATSSIKTHVSVVMSVYNDAGRIERAVTSILRQSHADLELIVVDDGSRDGSGALLDRMAAADTRLRVIHQENSGLTRALIRGCSEAKSEFIARQDSDDWSHPARIADQLALIQGDNRVGFVSCPTQYVGPRGEPLLVVSRTTDPAEATRRLRNCREGPPAHGSVLFRRALYERVGGYREEFYFAQDADLWLRMAEHAWIGYLPIVRYAFVREIESTSGAQRPIQRKFGEIGQLCREARERGGSELPFLQEAARLSATIGASRTPGAADLERSRADAAYSIGSQLALNGDRRAIRYLLKTIGLYPRHWKAWIRLAQAFLTGRRKTESVMGVD